MPPYERNPLPYIRRYITTHNTDGESIFLSHAQVPDYLPSTPTGEDGEIALLYATTNMPASVDAEADVAQYDEFLHQPPGITVDNGTLFRLIDLRPGKATPMHRTVSVDYGVIIEGDVDLVLDSGASRHMHRGDVSVQRGTAHSFRNRSDTEWCRMLFVYLPMEKINIQGKDLKAEVYDEGFDNPDDGGGNQGVQMRLSEQQRSYWIQFIKRLCQWYLDLDFSTGSQTESFLLAASWSFSPHLRVSAPILQIS